MKKSKNIRGPNLRVTKIDYTQTQKLRFEVTFGEMQNLQLSNCRNVKVKKHIFTVSIVNSTHQFYAIITW